MSARAYLPSVQHMQAKERELAKARWDEATAVKDAFDAQVAKRRATWRKAPEGKEADRARKHLQHALDQQKAALDQERLAWKAWHALRASQI